MTNRKTASLLLAAGLFLTACAAPSAGQSLTRDKSETKVTDSQGSESSIVSLEEFEAYKQEKDEEIQILNDEIANLKNSENPAPDNSAIAFRQRPAGMLYFPILMQDTEEEEPYARGYVAIRPQDPVTEKLSLLTTGVSQLLFNGLAMEFTGIQEEDGKQVAWIDLKGKADWQPVFQGSTGGGLHSRALVQTYLQENYRNSWVDGVHFTLDGQPVQYEHAPILEETIFR